MLREAEGECPPLLLEKREASDDEHGQISLESDSMGMGGSAEKTAISPFFAGPWSLMTAQGHDRKTGLGSELVRFWNHSGIETH